MHLETTIPEGVCMLSTIVLFEGAANHLHVFVDTKKVIASVGEILLPLITGFVKPIIFDHSDVIFQRFKT